MVVTTDRYATRVGIEVLQDGGNAVDAAVAVSFALAVVNPEAGNLGGGGFLLARTADGDLTALDYRSTAPAAAHPEMFRTRDESGVGGAGVADSLSVTGHRAVGVPGAVRGLWEAHRNAGRIRWERLVEPAIRLAGGFEVTPRLVASFTPDVVAGLRRFPETARIFLPRPGGRPPKVGDTLRQPDLAGTLVRIRAAGADGFYRGETADRIATEMAAEGGLIGLADLERYEAEWRRPVQFRYRGVTVVSMPPSSSGGVTLAATANILAGFDLSDLERHGAEHVHLLAEAWRRAYADRNHYLADPGYVEIPVETLASARYGAWRARDLSVDRATPSAGIGPGVERYRTDRERGEPGRPPAESPSTTHVSIVDPQGSAVSLTTTLNTWYGSKVVVPGTGVLLNNEMDDFTTAPGRPNFFGLVQGEANRIEPGKRMLSAMTPTLVLGPGSTRGFGIARDPVPSRDSGASGDGGVGMGGSVGVGSKERLLLVLGTPGGATIISTVFQVLSNVVDFGLSMEEAVRVPRVHHQHLPDRIEIEPGGLDPEVIGRLESFGHVVQQRSGPWGDVQAIRVRGDGTLEGQSDPRRGGAALGF